MTSCNTFIPRGIVKIIIICSLSFSIGCDEEEPIVIPLGNEATLRGTINIYVTECTDLFCQQENELRDVKVEIAVDSLSEAVNLNITNEKGFTSFSLLSNNTYVLRCTYKDQTFHERIRLSANTSSTHSIRFSKHCELVGTELKNCNPRIDFNSMAVGQRSKYARYISNELHSSEDKSFDYTGEILEVTVMEEIAENAWLVRETFTEPVNIANGPYSGIEDTLYNRWEIDGVNVRIIRSDQFNYNQHYSFLSNLFVDDPYQSTQLINRCELNGWSFVNCLGVDYPYIQDVIINGFRYQDSLMCSFEYTIDGPNFGMLFNMDEGILHTYFYGHMAPSKAHGFSLIK